MPEAPSGTEQLVLLVLFVLPGICYQFDRERLRGPVPGERDLSERVLRAVIASISLDTLYLIAAGPQIVHAVKSARSPWSASATADPRAMAALGLLLFLAVPAAAAWAVELVQRQRRPARFQPVPTAWDRVFRERSPCFIRLRLKNGGWAGGWYGKHSHASAYPNPADLFLESAYIMRPDGSFGPRVQGTAGLYVTMNDIDVIEFIEAAGQPTRGQQPPLTTPEP